MVRSDAKLKNMPPEVLDELWDLKYPADPQEQAPLPLLSIVPIVRDRYNVEIGKSALAEFYQWLEVKRDQEAQARYADQVMEDISKDHTLTPEQIKRAGQRIFMTLGMMKKDAAVFKAAVDTVQNDKRLAQNDAALRLREQAGERESRKLAILEAKAAKADQASSIANDEGMSEEEKAAKIKQLFRMG